MTDSHTAGGVSSPATVEPSGPTESPWLRILFNCLIWTGAAALLIAAVSLFSAGAAGLLSAFFGTGIVMVFFAISLLIGHFVGRKNPTGALSAFAVAYVVKFVGFAALFMVMGAPAWLAPLWFFVAALASVVIWQLVEVVVFSRTRQQIFTDPGQPEVKPSNG